MLLSYALQLLWALVAAAPATKPEAPRQIVKLSREPIRAIQNQHELDQGHLVKRQSDVALGEEPAPYNKYTGQVSIGQGSAFDFMFDTGSGVFWVQGSTCSSVTGGPCQSRPSFDPSTDSSFVATGQHQNISYSGGKSFAAGPYYNAPFSFGGLSGTGSIMVASQEGHYVEPASGILGLNFQAGQGATCATKALGLQGFGYWIDAPYSGGSAELALNGVDQSKVSGSFTYGLETPVNRYEERELIQSQEPLLQPPSRWETTVSSWSVAGTDASGSFPVQGVVIDSGTNGITLDEPTAQAILSAVGADTSTRAISCTGNPDLVLTFASGNQYTLPGSVYTVQVSAGSCVAMFDGKASHRTSDPRITFGATFMRAQYTYFDIANNRIENADVFG